MKELFLKLFKAKKSEKLFQKVGVVELVGLEDLKAILNEIVARDWNFEILKYKGLVLKNKISYLEISFEEETPYLESVLHQIRSLLGNSVSSPKIYLSKKHVHRQIFPENIEVGLWNCKQATVCFWNGVKLCDHTYFNDGEVVAFDKRRQRSVLVDDSCFVYSPRAVLAFTSRRSDF